jgi:hypothetical protein
VNLADSNPRRQGVNKPWQSRTEYLVDQALDTWFAEDDALRNMVSPAVTWQHLPNPDRTGFRKREATIEDVLNIDRYMPTNHSWVSGFPMQKTFVEDQSQSAGSRYSMGSLWT